MNWPVYVFKSDEKASFVVLQFFMSISSPLTPLFFSFLFVFVFGLFVCFVFVDQIRCAPWCLFDVSCTSAGAAYVPVFEPLFICPSFCSAVFHVTKWNMWHQPPPPPPPNPLFLLSFTFFLSFLFLFLFCFFCFCLSFFRLTCNSVALGNFHNTGSSARLFRDIGRTWQTSLISRESQGLPWQEFSLCLDGR